MTEPRSTILVIEDEVPMRRFLKVSLVANGYQFIEAENGQDGLTQAAAWNPQLILLDLGLPDMDGITLTQRLREWATMPIIVISARGREEDKIRALDSGANDYVTKPFGVGELLARIRAALRQQTAIGTADEQFVSGDLKVDLARRQVFVDGREVHLTPIEYKLLTLLIKHAGRVLTHHQLLKEVWGPNSREQTQYLRVYMGQLRHKLERTPGRPVHLLTEPGVGYRLRYDG